MLDSFSSLLADRPFVVLLLGGLLLLWLVSRVNEELRIRRLGAHAPSVRQWVPFGIGFVFDGVAHMMTDDNLNWWHKNFLKNDNPKSPYTVETRVAGERMIITADPENIKAVLATQFNDFGKGSEFNKDFREFLGDGIFATDGKHWHDSRQLVRTQFIKDRVSDMECFERHCSTLIPMLGGQGQTVDLKDLFFRFTLDAATDFLMGRSIDSLHNPQSEFANSFARIQHLQSFIARVGLFKNVLPTKREIRKHVAVVDAFVNPYIDEALALSQDELEKRTKTEQGYTFLHAIAAYTRDRKVLRDQLVNVLLAGRDTTACTLSWLFWELARNPQIVADLRQEIQERVGFNRAPSYDDLKNMKMLQHTMNETLRLYPVVPFNVRVALKDTTIPRGGGPNGDLPVSMPKDTPFAYSTHYMQLTPEIYPPVSADFPPPDVFAPRRWEKWTPKNWTYIPFNGGPRICVGQNFALSEMGYTVVRILQHFSKIESRPHDALGGLDEKGRMEDAGLRGGFEGVGGAKSAEKPRVFNERYWYRRQGDQPDLIEKAIMPRDNMISELVLQPGRPVKVALFQ